MKLTRMNFVIVGILIPLCYVRLTIGIQCQRITVPACQGLGYNMTAMPNLAGHNNQIDAENMVS